MAFSNNKPTTDRQWANSGSKVTPNNAQIDLGWIAEKPPFEIENWLNGRTDQYLADP